MSKYRFKTEEEFKEEGLWNEECKCPSGWEIGGHMNKYMGEEIPKEFNINCDKREDLCVGGWLFDRSHYVLNKEINPNCFEYFGDTLMEVSDEGKYWKTRVVFGKKNGRYIAWMGVDNLEGVKEECRTAPWNHAKPIKTKITLQEVADKFGLNKNEIEIVDCEE